MIHPTQEEAIQTVKAIEQTLENKTAEELINQKQTFDDRVISLISILLTMLDITYFINMELYLLKCELVKKLTLMEEKAFVLSVVKWWS